MTPAGSFKPFVLRHRFAVLAGHGGIKAVWLVGSGLSSALVLGLLPLPAVAATVVSTLGVSARVLPPPGTCLIESANMVPDAPGNAQSHAVPAVSIECTGAMPYAVSLNANIGAGAVVTTSRVTGHFAATWSYAPSKGGIRLVGWSNNEGGGSGEIRDTGPTTPTPIVHDWSAAAVVPTAPLAGVDTIMAIVRY